MEIQLRRLELEDAEPMLEWMLDGYGIFIEHICAGGEYKDICWFSLTKADYEQWRVG